MNELETKLCPDCPDGNVWNINGPTGATCPTCKGYAVVNLNGEPLNAEQIKIWNGDA